MPTWMRKPLAPPVLEGDEDKTRIATRMRETLDVGAVLQTAVQQMRSALELAEVEVRMGSYDTDFIKSGGD